MLDDLFKVAVVDITNRYDGPPAAKVAKAIFAAAKEKQYFKAKLLDATGSPQNEANVPQDDFEKRAAKAMTAGQDVPRGGGRARARLAACAWRPWFPPSSRSVRSATASSKATCSASSVTTFLSSERRETPRNMTLVKWR